jgi:hypothetical protein
MPVAKRLAQVAQAAADSGITFIRHRQSKQIACSK